nr:uncharacterized protein LOC129256719 [Lytechinus pictus]
MGKSRPKLQRSFSTIKRQFTFRKSIRPFISSTFLDFQDERGHLQRYVFPQLNSVCHSRGTFFAPADLRWGINNEQSSSGNVISLCLEYINRCSPFFICLLGERYGTHRPNDAPLLPSSLEKLPRNMSWLDRNYLIAASKGHEWIMQEAYQYCSVTELEIIQAAILNDSKYCRFYVRDVRHVEDKFLELPEKEREEKLKMYMAEDEETEIKVTTLKQKLINRGMKIQFFRTPEELGQKVLDDWMEIINELYPPLDELLGDVDGEQFREWAAHEAYAETRRRVFVLTPEIQKLFTKMTDHCEEWMDPTTTAEKVDEWVIVKGKKKKIEDTPASKSIVTLIGERGCGKTSLVANWVKQFQGSHPDIKVLAHYVGSSALSTDICSFLRRVTFELRGEFGGDSPAETNGDSEELSNFHRICEAFVAAIAMGPCAIVLDAVDELSSTMGMGVHQVKEMKWLPDVLPSHCKIIITTVRSDLTYKSLMNRPDCETLSVPLFESTADKGTVIERHLAMHCKCLDASHLKKIVNCKLSSRPLFLTVLANELRVCGTFDNLPDLLKRYVKAPSFRDLWKSIISRWTKEYGWSTEGRLSASMSNFGQIDPFTGWVAETLRLLACSRHGLSETDILSLLKQMGYKGQSAVTSFDFALFRSAAFDALVERPGGLFGFFHQDLRDAVLNSLLGVIPGLTSDQTSSSGVGFLPQMLNGQMQQCHEHLADFFLHQPSSRRRVEELPYHLDRCGDVNGLNKIVTNPDTFLAMQADTSQNITLKLDLIHYCNRLSKENFNITTSLTKMVSEVVTKEDNPNQVKSNSRVSFADDVGEMVMRSATRMDWELPGFKKKLDKKMGSIGIQSDNFSSQSSKPPMIDLTAGKQAAPPSASFGSGGHQSIFSDFESMESRRTIEKSTFESGEEEYIPREDLTMSRATRTDLDSITSKNEATPPPPPPPLSSAAFSGIGNGSRDGMESGWSEVESSRSGVESRRSEVIMSGQSHPDSQVEEVIVREEFTALLACPDDMSFYGSNYSDERSPKESILDDTKTALSYNREDSQAESSIPNVPIETSDAELSRSLASFVPGEEDMLDDLVKSLGDAFEISNKSDGEVDKLDYEKEKESDIEAEPFDENRIRCKGALLAMHVGKFLAEKSAFDQSEEMLMLAYDRIIDMFPLSYKEQLLLVEVQESIGDRHLFQLRKDEAKRFFRKALNSLEHIIEEETYDNIKPILETKGRLLTRIGSMAVHDRHIEEAEEILMEASQCMKQANSVAGIATAQFNLGFLKMKVEDYQSAESCQLEALQTRERWYGSAHPLVAEVLNELAGLLCRYDNEISYDRIKAEVYYRRALKIRQDALGKDHLLVATTLFHLGKLLRDDGSFQSKKEALELMSRALDIRTTKFGAHHKLTYAIRNSIKGLRKELDRGDYDRAPVKPPDKRTKNNPRSNLSWREQELLSVGGRSGSPSRRGSSYNGRNSPRSIDRSPSPRPGSRYGGSVRHGSMQYNSQNKERGNGGGIRRDRAQSSPQLKYNGRSSSGSPQNRSSTNRKVHSAATGTQQKDCRPSSSSSSSSSSYKGPTLKAKYLYNGRPDAREDGVSFAEGHTILGNSEMSDETCSKINGIKEKNQPRQGNGRTYSSVSSSMWDRGPKSLGSEMSGTGHRRDIPSPYDSNLHGPNSNITSLLGEPAGPRSNTVDPLHDAAFYHGPGRYPKDQRDFYPPRRHQQRQNSHKLPLLNPTNQVEKIN